MQERPISSSVPQSIIEFSENESISIRYRKQGPHRARPSDFPLPMRSISHPIQLPASVTRSTQTEPEAPASAEVAGLRSASQERELSLADERSRISRRPSDAISEPAYDAQVTGSIDIGEPALLGDNGLHHDYIQSTGHDLRIQTDASGNCLAKRSSTTSETTPQLSTPADVPNQILTPSNPIIESSDPLSLVPSSPFDSTANARVENTNPFSNSGSQQAAANIKGAVPGNSGGDIVGKVELPNVKSSTKKENIYPKREADIKPSKAEDTKSNLKSHEASSNLSKASPNHPSIPSQTRSAKKIRTPFRSPLFNKTLASNQQQLSSDGPPSRAIQNNLSSALQLAKVTPELKKRGALSRIKGTGTTAARAAFKSPIHPGKMTSGLPKPTANVPSSSRKSTTTSRNDTAQNRLQLLRRAVMIKESGEDEKLEVLVVKWKEVAKEVAWELWGLVKEGNIGEGGDSRSLTGPQAGAGDRTLNPFGGNAMWGGSGFDAEMSGRNDGQSNWGWDDAGEEGDGAAEFAGASDGMEEAGAPEDEDVDTKVEERSMGAMLRQLGIAEETLGWDEEEGDFKELAA